MKIKICRSRAMSCPRDERKLEIFGKNYRNKNQEFAEQKLIPAI